MKKIVHLTSVHKRYDVRIFLKQCVSLVNDNYDVYLVVADGLGDETKLGVKIIDVGLPRSNRFSRMLSTTKCIYNKALKLDADLYHFHDPELIPTGVKLKKKTLSKVIFDSHEDVPKQILGKPYLNNYSKVFISYLFAKYQYWACKKIDAVVVPTPSIKNEFERYNIKVVEVRNYPIIQEFALNSIDWTIKSNRVSYVGCWDEDRGLLEMLDAVSMFNKKCKLSLGGSFSSVEFEKRIKKHPSWVLIDDRGWLDRDSINMLLSDSVAGLVTLRPAINFIDSLPVKMFEYMAAGLPVIASNFPLWKEIIENEECGICVNPLKPVEIAEAIDFLLENLTIAEEMGRKGRKAVFEKYNWDLEAKKLLGFYNLILN